MLVAFIGIGWQVTRGPQIDGVPVTYASDAPETYAPDDSPTTPPPFGSAKSHPKPVVVRRTAPPTAEPTPKPEPTLESYDHMRHRQKLEFLAGVDESISAAKIVGNKLKYVGDSVELHCTVVNILDQTSFNAQCGEDDDALPVIILITYEDTSSLDKDQSVRILGVVSEPVDGTNGFGGAGTFAAVHAEYME